MPQFLMFGDVVQSFVAPPHERKGGGGGGGGDDVDSTVHCSINKNQPEEDLQHPFLQAT